MKTKIIVAAIALLLTMPVIAQFKPVTHGYEVALSSVRLPRNDGGTIAYKPCATCDYETSRVNADARWEINGKAVSLPQFRKRTDRVADPDSSTVTVIRHIESRRVTGVFVTIRDAE